MRYFIVILLVALIGAANACQSQAGLDALAGSEWQVTCIGDLTVDSEAYLQFRIEGQVAGRTGINSLGGSYSIEGASLTFGPLMVTKMAGPSELMEQEAKMLEALGTVDGFRRDGIRLTLTRSGTPVMALRQTDWD